jgi:hypothetical protein
MQWLVLRPVRVQCQEQILGPESRVDVEDDEVSAVELADSLVWVTVVDVASWSKRLLMAGRARRGTDNGGLLSPSTANASCELSEGKHLMRCEKGASR